MLLSQGRRSAADPSDRLPCGRWSRHRQPSARPPFCCTHFSLQQVFQYGWRGDVGNKTVSPAAARHRWGGGYGARAQRRRRPRNALGLCAPRPAAVHRRHVALRPMQHLRALGLPVKACQKEGCASILVPYLQQSPPQAQSCPASLLTRPSFSAALSMLRRGVRPSRQRLPARVDLRRAWAPAGCSRCARDPVERESAGARCFPLCLPAPPSLIHL